MDSSDSHLHQAPAGHAPAAVAAAGGRFGLRLFSPAAVVASFLLLGGLLWFSHDLAQEPPKIDHASLAGFPTEISGFHLIKDVQLDQATLNVLRPTEVLMRYYQRSEQEPPVSLYIPFFATQEEDSRIHNPAACLPGAGWQIVSRVREPLPWRGKTAYANLVTLQKGLDWQMGLYWIHSRGRVVAGEYRAKLYLMYDVFTQRRRDGALVRLMTSVAPGPDRAVAMGAAKVRLLDLANGILPILPEYLPN